MISDRENKAIKDFYSSPVSRRHVAGGYIVTGFIISIIMSIFTLIFGEIYLGLAGGAVLDVGTLLKLFAVIVLSAFASSAIASFMISFLKTNSSYSAASTVVGTLIGFLVGAYIGWGIHSNRQLARQRSMAGKVLPMCSFSGTLPAAFDEACN
ncbi:ABC transporter [Lactobacillus delbrueckii subsp. delbrueckii DSM 20074 = JCM 1012]|nr:ABC transporter [Lactobacillus delbrueckii subsp. delbrueckii DSM 20074 = JCM 1012]